MMRGGGTGRVYRSSGSRAGKIKMSRPLPYAR